MAGLSSISLSQQMIFRTTSLTGKVEYLLKAISEIFSKLANGRHLILRYLGVLTETLLYLIGDKLLLFIA